jgi:hypothetical protein
VALAGLLLAAGGTLAYVRSEIVDRRAFSERLAASLGQASVRDVVTERLVDQVVGGSRADLLTVRPLVTRAVAAAVAAPSFRRAAALAARDAHSALVGEAPAVIVRLRSGLPALADAVRARSPAAAALAVTELRAVLAEIERGDAELDGTRTFVDVSEWWWPLLVGSLLAAAAALLLARRRLPVLGLLGAAAAAAGALGAGAAEVAGVAASNHLARARDLDRDDEREAMAAIWDELFGDLVTSALVVAAGGLVLSGLVALALRRWAAGTAREEARALRPRAGFLAGAGLIALVAAATAAVVVALGAPESPPAARAGGTTGCNGSPALCRRRLNEVVLAGTHNSYAAAGEPGWLFANQRRPIERQLEDGIRALLIDVHFGVRDPRRNLVRTDLRGEDSSRNKVVRELGPQAVRAADRLAGRIGVGELEGTREPFLCHTLCELGAEPLAEELAVIRRFLEREPREVLVLVVEPYVPPAEIERALDVAGLLELSAELDRDGALPTLGELVRSDRRLVVFAEEDGGVLPWYMPAFSFIQDTPLGARRPRELRCERFRGEPESPLLLLNHWIDHFPPRPSTNDPINTGRFLRRRIASCTRARGIAPAIVAVDFYERGDVVEVARELNAAR